MHQSYPAHKYMYQNTSHSLENFKKSGMRMGTGQDTLLSTFPILFMVTKCDALHFVVNFQKHASYSYMQQGVRIKSPPQAICLCLKNCLHSILMSNMATFNRCRFLLSLQAVHLPSLIAAVVLLPHDKTMWA